MILSKPLRRFGYKRFLRVPLAFHLFALYFFGYQGSTFEPLSHATARAFSFILIFFWIASLFSNRSNLLLFTAALNLTYTFLRGFALVALGQLGPAFNWFSVGSAVSVLMVIDLNSRKAASEGSTND